MSKKTQFSLKIADTAAVDTKYGICKQKNIIPKNATRITDLQVNMEPNVISFLDEAKRPKKCIPTMLSTLGDFLPEKTEIKCFWCRNDFNTAPIGCPLRYVPSNIEKTYISEITKDKYTIKENLGKSSFPIDMQPNDKIEYKINTMDYYETDGIFCSFNCLLSYILENTKNPMYRNSRNLLYKLYFDIFGYHPKELIPAPSWRLLQEYGGPLSITTFRKSFNKLEYIDNGKIIYIPKFKTVERIYEEKSRFN